MVRLQQDQKDRNQANQWMDKIEKEEQEKSSGLMKVVSDMVKSDMPVSSPFVSEFTKRLSSRNPAFGIVKNWFDQKLQDEGVTLEELIHRETQH
ncbi:MAG: hypothetical protein LUH15_02840 [Tannerellaceae bacterium]|nr:hypothetical protein [Tannerellaceae bacterium]